MTLSVEAVGPLVTVQDLGRPGNARLGVSPSGAADRGALRLANRLLGNPAGAAALEVLLGGLVLRADEPAVVAVTGAPAPITVGDSPAPLCAPVRLAPSQALRVGMPVTGLRTYVAVRGGLDVPRLLGSASTDVTWGLGPPVVAPGQVLRAGTSRGLLPSVIDQVAPSPAPSGDVVLHGVLGPRDDWFSPWAWHVVRTCSWTVSSDSDRVAVRLSGPPLQRREAGELPSEPVLRGAVQVPPSGQPLVFLAEHPTTGGYPVVAVVDEADTDRLAQVRPGEQVRFALRHATWV